MPALYRRHLLTAIRLAWLVALVFSVALYVHYVDPANSGYCSGGSGCEAVRRSGFSYFLGKTWLNVPFIGVACFFGALTLSFLPLGASLRPRVLGAIAILGALVALVLIGVQWLQIGAACWLCMVVDVSALAAGSLATPWLLHPEQEQADPLAPWAWIGGGLLVALAPVGLWLFKPAPPIPDGVARLYQPGKINVVEFADFQCPYCRTMHGIFQRLNAEYGDRVNFHQLHMPLPGHEHAFRAAAAAVCAEERGKGDEMKHRLFTQSLSASAPLRHAQALGFDTDEFESCMDSAATSRRIEADKEILRQSGFRGLPTTFVGAQRIVGWRVYPAMKEAYELAARADGGRGVELPSWLFLGVVGAAVVAIGVTGRRPRNGLAKA